MHAGEASAESGAGGQVFPPGRADLHLVSGGRGCDAAGHPTMLHPNPGRRVALLGVGGPAPAERRTMVRAAARGGTLGLVIGYLSSMKSGPLLVLNLVSLLLGLLFSAWLFVQALAHSYGNRPDRLGELRIFLIIFVPLATVAMIILSRLYRQHALKLGLAPVILVLLVTVLLRFKGFR
jgi:hypothetical protein